MGANPRQTLDDLIAESDTLLASALNPAVEPIMASYELGKPQITVQQNNLKKVRELATKRILEQAESVTATKIAAEKEAQFHSLYTDTLGFARITFKTNYVMREQLQIDDRRKSTINGYLEQAQKFYQALLGNPEAVAAYKRFGKTEDHLREELMILDEYRVSEQAKQKESAEAETATEKRDAALETLLDWIAEYKGIARIALKNRPDLLRLLNI